MAEVATPPPAPTGAVGASTVTRLLPGDLSFQTVLDFACSVQRARGPGSQARKEAMVQGFIRDNIARESRRAWEVFRLLLPHLDMHRPPCMLQEARLGTFLLQAAAIPEGSERWRRVKGWIDPLLADKHTVGQFAEVLCKCLFNEHCAVVPGTPQSRQLKVAHVNELLDRLSAAAGNTDLVVPLLRELYQRTTPQQLKHLVQIIQRDHRIQLGEAYIFPRWHPDAAACYAHCCDARQVFNGLCDPAVPFQAGLELGSCAQPQLSLPMYSSRALVENMQRLEAKSREALAAQPAPAEAAVAGAATGACNGSGIGRGGGSGRPSDGGKGGAQGPAAIAGQQAGTVQFLVEIKLDGERQQIHMPADPSQPCNYFSRRGIDHGPELERQGGGRFRCFDPVVRAQVRARDVILDGELLSWNRSRRRFEVFGSWRSMVRALNEGAMPSDLLDCADYDGNLNVVGADWEAPMLQDLEACYVCWDILWADGRPLAQLPLLERHRLLRQAVGPAPREGIPLVPTRPSAPRRGALRGRIVLLLPGEAIFPGVPVPRVCSTVPEVDAAIREAMTLGLEGIVAKRLSSPWTAGDRSGNWVKFKPDYVDRVDLDGVIIGVWHGERERSGKYGEFLLGIRCRRSRGLGNAGQAGSSTGGNGDGDDDGSRGESGGSSGRGAASQTWASFVKVGAGLRMAELERLTALLEPHTCQQPPSCYQLTGHYKERPHLYIRDPLDSIVLEVQADLRLTCSCYYASEYSLRFPRVERIRWDKGALQASDEEELRIRARSRKEQKVQEELHCMLQLGQGARLWSPCKTRKALASEAPRRRGRLALGACPATVKAQSSALSGCCLFILNYLGHDQQHCQKLVRQLGGSIWSVATFEPARVGSSYTHVLAGAPLPAPGVRPKGCEAKNWRLAAGAGCDVLSLGWLASCFAAGRLVEPAAADYLQLSAATLQGHPSWDAFGDDYFRRATVEDVATALLRMPAPEALEDRGALEGWLDGRHTQAALLTQQQEAGASGGAGGSAGGQDEAVLEGERPLLRRIAALAAGQPGGARRAAELAAEVDAELAALGLLDASALMHGCRVAVLPLLLGAERELHLHGRSTTAADSQTAESAATDCPSLLAGVARLEAETQQCQARLVGYAASSLAALVAVHGGSVSSSVDDRDTHLLVVQPIAEPSPAASAAVAQLATALAAAAEVGQAAVEQAAKADERLAERRAALLAAATQAAASCAPQPVKSADLIAAVSRQAGGQAAVAALWRRVDAGQLALVAPSWVEASVKAAAQRAGLPLPPAPDNEHALLHASGNADAAAGKLAWPRELFAAASPLEAAAGKNFTGRAEIEQAGEEAVQAGVGQAQAASDVRAQLVASAQEPAMAAAADAAAEAACGSQQHKAARGVHCAAHGSCAAGGIRVPCSGPAAAGAALTTAAAAMVGAAVANIPRVAAAAAVASASPAPPLAAKPAPLLSPPAAPASRPGADRQPARQAASLPGPGLQVCPPAEGAQQAQLASRPRLAPAEQQASKRRRIICFGLPREQQAVRRRPLFQQGPSELRESEPQDGRKRSQCLQPAQHVQRAQGAVPLMSAMQAASAPALAPALPSMFDMLFGRHQPSQGCKSAGAAAWEASAPAAQQQVPPIAFPPASASKAAPASTCHGASYSASHSSSHSAVARHVIGEPRTPAAAPPQSHQDARQEHSPQGAAALASGSQDRVQADAAVGQGLRGRMATLRALSQQQEEERTRREVAEASQG